MPQKPRLWCADCGAVMHQMKASLPQGRARCHPCRRASPPPLKPCAHCGKPEARRTYCSRLCSGRASNALRTFRDPDDSRVTRALRDRSAPGLSSTKRRQLLAMWRRQGRSCAYCPARAEAVDHVVPLIRGGTNWEGNLTPVCRSCNSSKAGWLLTEWRTGRRCTPTTYALPTPSKPRPVRLVAAEQVAIAVHCCTLCLSPFMAERVRKYCSSECERELHARTVRERYRARVGLPPTWDQPVRKRWAA